VGGMVGSAGMGGWTVLWIFLGLALAVTAGVVVARALGWHRADRPEIGSAEPPAVRQAKDALRLRYANGEISREDYLQGKVELED
jgi:putative membrane protein